MRVLDTFSGEPHFLSGHADGSVRMYSLRENKSDAIYIFKDIFDSEITSVKLSINGNTFICTSKEGYNIKVFDLRK